MGAGDTPLHHVLDSRIHVAQERGGLEPEFPQPKIDPLVGVAAPRGDDAGSSAGGLELRIPDRGADRIHVGVLVSDDDGDHYFLRGLLMMFFSAQAEMFGVGQAMLVVGIDVLETDALSNRHLLVECA